MIQVYGRFGDFWSHAQVSRGIVRGLLENGIKRLLVWNIDGTGDYVHLPDGAEVGLDATADVGFFVGGYPPMVSVWLDQHPFKAALFITESEVIPSIWAAIAASLDLVICPSMWCDEVYRHAGGGSPLVVRHGLDPIYASSIPDYRRGSFPVFKHICGAASFPDRKGLPQLLEAFRKVFEERPGRLLIRAPQVAEIPRLQQETETWHPVSGSRILWTHHDGRLQPESMRSALLNCDFLVQPSRVEAFGLVPVEARALGIPVILTGCTGHLDHLEAGDFVVKHGSPGPIRVNGIPVGRAPTVKADAVATALEQALELWATWGDGGSHHPDRPRGYYDKWSWKTVTAELATRLKELSPKRGRSLDAKLGVS